MRILWKPLQWLYCIYGIVIFIPQMVVVFVISLVAILFGEIRGGNIIYKTCCIWSDVWTALMFVRHKNIYEQKPNKKKSYIYVANHISYLDPVILVKSIRYPVRALGKAEMAKVPLFGFIYKNAIVTVDRSHPEKRAHSLEELKKMLAHGVSVFFFPEGTFNQTHQPLKNFYNGAFKIAIETGTPIKPVLFLDAYDRWHYNHFFSLNPGKSRTLFLAEVDVTGYTLKDAALLRDKVYRIMEEKLIEYKASWIKDAAV